MKKKTLYILGGLLLGLGLSLNSTRALATATDMPEEELINYRIIYDTMGGTISDEVDIPTTFTVEDQIVLPTPVKQGYLFGGWYTSKSFVREMPVIPKGTIAYGEITEDYVPGIHVFARWIEPETEVPSIHSIYNLASGLMTVWFNPTTLPVDGYELQYSTDSTFETKSHTLNLDALTPASIKNRRADTTYYVRVRSYAIDSIGEKVYSDYSFTKIIHITKGSSEMEPTVDAGTINSAVISGGSVVVSCTIPDRIAGADDNYYLVKYDPLSGGAIGVLASSDKDEDVTFTFGVSGNLMAQFAIAVKEDDTTYTRISPCSFIDNPEALASYTAPHPKPASKKGRQGTYNTEMGDKHYFHNFYLDEIIASAGSYDVAYNYNGRTYYFYNPTHHINYDSDIMVANANGGTVTMQIMIRWSGNSTDLITPTGRTPGYNYYAFNVEEAGAREKLEAAFMFISEYWSKPNRHVDNWILGNEVNTFLNTTGRWYWAGNVSRETFMTNYSNTFRILYYAVKCHNANGYVYTCTDHTWNDRDRDWGTMGFITSLNSHLKAMNPNIQWNLANHAYTAVLTNADPWNDGAVRIYSVAHSTGASFVSPYNLEVLTNYVANNFGSGVRIILSEVGFSYTGGTNAALNGGRQSGYDVQAAATAYLYYKAHFTSNIDACIFHTGNEGEPGKNFNIEGLPAGDVYTFMDTPSYAEHCNGYLPVINGATSWESIIPGFSSSALSGMPGR